MKQVISYFMRKVKEDNIGAYAAQAALFFIMSMIPFLLVLLSLLRFTPVTEGMVLSWIELISPGYVSSTVVSIVMRYTIIPAESCSHPLFSPSTRRRKRSRAALTA